VAGDFERRFRQKLSGDAAVSESRVNAMRTVAAVDAGCGGVIE